MADETPLQAAKDRVHGYLVQTSSYPTMAPIGEVTDMLLDLQQLLSRVEEPIPVDIPNDLSELDEEPA